MSVASEARNSPLALPLVAVPGSVSDDDGNAMGGRSVFTARRGGSAARPPAIAEACSLLCPSPSTLGRMCLSVHQAQMSFKVSQARHRFAAAALGLPCVDRLTCVEGYILFNEHGCLFWCARDDEGKGARGC